MVFRIPLIRINDYPHIVKIAFFSQKRSPRLVVGASLLEYLEGIRTGAVVNGAPGALQSRDPASAAAEVESHPVPLFS